MSPERLETALGAFCEHPSVENRRELVGALAASELFFVIDERETPEAPIRLAFTHDASGNAVVPGFTDKGRLALWLRTGGPIAQAPASGFVPALLSGPFAGLVVNPGSEASVVVYRRVLEALSTQDEASLERSIAGEFTVVRWL